MNASNKEVANPAAPAKQTRSRRQPGTPGKPTIKAVAERAGVAISTVSRVVNGGAASKLAKERVSAAIAELGYTPSVAAQSLVSRRAGCIGLAVNSSQSPWFNQILLGVEEALAPSRKSVLLASTMLNGRYDAGAVLSWIQQRRVDGLIIVRYSRREEPLLKAATRAGLPTVLIAPDLTAPSEFIVRCNNIDAGHLAGQHLLDLGHERIAFAGGPRDSIDTQDRLTGLTQTLVKAGAPEPADIWFGRHYSVDDGEEYANVYLQMPKKQRPSAVVLGNDPMALGFMRTLLHAGEQIPESASVVGFDGTSDGAVFWPGLTTVVQPTQRMAARACDALLDAIEDDNQERGASLEYAVELVVRQSTAPPGSRSRR